MKDEYYDCIVVGGGASGLMASIFAARHKIRTAVLEHAARPAAKLLLTGSGRCNITNMEQGSGFYHCSDPAFVLSTLDAFTADDTIDIFREMGVLTTRKGSYVYPRSMQSSGVRDALLSEAGHRGVNICCDTGIRNIKKCEDGFHFDTKSGSYRSKSCVLACGGRSYPGTGSDGSGFIYAKALGHSVNDQFPALVPLICSSNPLKAASGVRCIARVSIVSGGETLASDTGELQITDYGISGIVTFQVSRAASQLVSRGERAEAVIDFLPEYSHEEAFEFISGLSDLPESRKTWTDIISGLINSRAAAVICSDFDASHTPVSRRSQSRRRQEAFAIVKKLKGFSLDVTDTRGYRFAQATAGGISTDEIRRVSMQSKIVPGLFFAGEMIDADGACGGYNLQWAWSTGALAGSAAAAYVCGIKEDVK